VPHIDVWPMRDAIATRVTNLVGELEKMAERVSVPIPTRRGLPVQRVNPQQAARTTTVSGYIRYDPPHQAERRRFCLASSGRNAAIIPLAAAPLASALASGRGRGKTSPHLWPSASR
jgi:hypothetical protein